MPLKAIKVDYEVLPVVTNAEEALKAGAPQLHEAVPGNLCTHVTYGDKAADRGRDQERRGRRPPEPDIPRQIHQALETRATLAEYDPATG